MNQAKPASDDARAPENAAYLFRSRVRRNIEILRFQSEKKIADRTADYIGRKPFLLKAGRDASCTRTDFVPGKSVLGARDYMRVGRAR